MENRTIEGKKLLRARCWPLTFKNQICRVLSLAKKRMYIITSSFKNNKVDTIESHGKRETTYHNLSGNRNFYSEEF